MNPFRLLSHAILFFSVIAAHSPVAAASYVGTVDGMVVSVSDGDHITVVNNGKEINVVLYGIDAPVITKIHRGEPWLSKPGQPFAGRAFMALSNKVLHKQVTLEVMKIDSQGRMIAVVLAGGRNINLEMVAEGWAWAAQTKRKADDPAYQRAEESARSKKAGLWSQDNPIPPWEFRKTRKINKDSW